MSVKIHANHTHDAGILNEGDGNNLKDLVLQLKIGITLNL